MILIITYKNAFIKCAFLIISKSSRENVLNVVNPPQKPTVSVYLIAGLSFCFSMKNIYKNPIKKLPATFTIKVAGGRLKCEYLSIISPVRYRITAPIPPPVKIAIILSIDIHLN